jgi:predicted dehydrogenase
MSAKSISLFLFLAVTVLVSDDPEKREKLGKEYNLKSYTYDQFSQALEEVHCDPFYIATPNNQHRKFTVPAFEQGMCEPIFSSVCFIMGCRLSCFTGKTDGSFSRRL